ncbi:MAG: FtsQ-type POTRA domain-containing protein [Clostridiales bacterium]|jgi:cell division protein FtsQ|nr:FtsQ-type POTRA domain-containing protein [Clostridiales bacterium]
MARNGTKKGILMFLILLICFAAVVFIGTEVFQIKNIIVTCSGSLDENAIINASGINPGDNIFKISREQVRKRIESSPPFPVVEGISLKLPDEIHIIVEERVPAALVPYLSSYIMIDSSGFVLDIFKQTHDPSYPVVEGVAISKLTKGSPLELDQNGNYRQKVLIRLLESLEQWEVIDMIAVIYMDNPDDILLVTRDEIRVKLGQAVDLDRKLGWLKSDAYAEVIAKGEPGILDVSVPGKAVFNPHNQTGDEETEDQESGNGETEDDEQLSEETDQQ